MIAGFGLDEAEQSLVDYWLGAAGSQLRRWTSGDIQPGRLHRGLNYFPESRQTDRRELLGCYRPLLVLAGRAAQNQEAQAGLFESGIAACWKVPAPGEAIFFPALPRSRRTGPVFLIEDDPVYRSLFRQLLYFAGYDVRADQQSLELLETPEAFAEPGARLPALILASLDTPRLDIPAFFHRLNRFLKRHPGRGPRVMITKNFQRPGLDVRTIESSLRPHVARIFHPREATLALLEALFLSPTDPGARAAKPGDAQQGRPLTSADAGPGGEALFGSAFASTPPASRSLDELLYRPHIKLRETAPALQLRDETQAAFRRVQPFLWLYDRLAESDGRGAILNDPARS
ncbi:MAG: response regulator [Leptospirales bacterium]